MNKYYQYSKERFPLSQFIPLSLFLSLSAGIGIQYFLYGKIDSYLSLVLSFFALILFFLRLRLFDEHKDAEHDKEHYPDRPISRGLISLKDLDKIIFLVIVLEFLISIFSGFNSLFLFLLAFIYSLIMFKEFFAEKWLRDRFMIYIFSHEILVFPLFFYLFSIIGFLTNMFSEKYFWYLSLFIVLQLFLLEVTRKVRSKENEIKSRDTYTAQYGIVGASSLVMALSGMIVFLFYYLDILLFGSCIFISHVVSLVFLIFVSIIINFIKKPVHKNAKLVFNVSILFVFIIQFVFLIKFFL